MVTQNIDFVGVSNVHSTGQILAPTLNNDGRTGDAAGWFAAAVAAAVAAVAAPTLSWIGILLLALFFLGLAGRNFYFANRVIK